MLRTLGTYVTIGDKCNIRVNSICARTRLGSNPHSATQQYGLSNLLNLCFSVFSSVNGGYYFTVILIQRVILCMNEFTCVRYIANSSFVQIKPDDDDGSRC